jgi:hypothetical protein
MPKKYSDRKIPCDPHAESYVVGAGLKCWFNQSLDPVWFYDERLRSLYLATSILKSSEQLVQAKNGYDFQELLKVGSRNGALASQLISQSGIWNYSAGAPYLIELCLKAATQPQIVDYYAARMKTTYNQRREIWAAEDRLRAAWRAVSCR